MWQYVVLNINVQRIKEYFNLDLLVGSYQTGLVCGVNLEYIPCQCSYAYLICMAFVHV